MIEALGDPQHFPTSLTVVLTSSPSRHCNRNMYVYHQPQCSLVNPLTSVKETTIHPISSDAWRSTQWDRSAEGPIRFFALGWEYQLEGGGANGL